MTPKNHTLDRELQRDARAWARFTGLNYASAERQMSSPLASGLLGERVSARQLIATLRDHDLIGAHGGDPVLGEDGFHSQTSWTFNGKTDLIELALLTDMLRMFTPISGNASPEVSSYSLKHTAERILSPHCTYVSNGRLIWAAAAAGIPIASPDGAGPNLLLGVSEREHDYVRRMAGPRQSQPRADHYRPTGYEHLRTVLAQAVAGAPSTDRWDRPTKIDEPAPFHDWLILQRDRDDVTGHLARDYFAGVRDSDHRLARTPDELLMILHGVPSSQGAHDAAVRTIAEWMRSVPTSTPLRTEQIGRDAHDHGGWDAGPGTVERIEFRCPCGDSTIVEEHDNLPGFRDHDVRILCDKCRSEWRFVEGRSVRGWGLEPVAVGLIA